MLLALVGTSMMLRGDRVDSVESSVEFPIVIIEIRFQSQVGSAYLSNTA